eukprot:1958527-Pyramimonas_sp.AAC.1
MVDLQDHQRLPTSRRMNVEKSKMLAGSLFLPLSKAPTAKTHAQAARRQSQQPLILPAFEAHVSSVDTCVYQAFDSELTREREEAHALVEKYNDTRGEAAATERLDILKGLLGSFPEDAPPYIEPKF